MGLPAFGPAGGLVHNGKKRLHFPPWVASRLWLTPLLQLSSPSLTTFKGREKWGAWQVHVCFHLHVDSETSGPIFFFLPLSLYKVNFISIADLIIHYHLYLSFSISLILPPYYASASPVCPLVLSFPCLILIPPSLTLRCLCFLKIKVLSSASILFSCLLTHRDGHWGAQARELRGIDQFPKSFRTAFLQSASDKRSITERDDG